MNRFIFPVILLSICTFFAVPISFAQAGLDAKLPYAKGESFVVTQGYNSPPTHINKDAYAIDFTQDGCDAYGKPAVAAVAGTAWIVDEAGYNGGYGTQVLVESGGNVVGRYAHLIQGSIAVSAGDAVKHGTVLGKIGDTGLVAGTACGDHPGTHLHFALYDKNLDGSFTPQNPEPISGYTGIQEGGWYLSDNGPDDSAGDNVSQGAVLGASIGKLSSGLDSSSGSSSGFGSSSVSGSSSGGGVPIVPVGGSGIAIAILPSSPSPQISSVASVASGTSSPESESSSTGTDSSTSADSTSSPQAGSGQASSTQTESSSSPPADSTSSPQTASTSSDGQALQENFTASFNSSTLAVDFAWQPVDGVSSGSIQYGIFDLDSADSSSPTGLTASATFSLAVASSDYGQDLDFGFQAADASGSVFAAATATVPIPNWFAAIQPYDGDESVGSWYDDNWYDLGTGFYGTVRSLTLEGYVNTDRYPQFPAYLWLQEFLDPGYTALNQTFTISGGAPFTSSLAAVTIGGLNIPLQPNKYYRLATYEQLQNHSVILKGTVATGTAMWDEFINGTGIVRHDYPFYPYISAIMIPNYPPSTPPFPPASLSFSFDQFGLDLGISWPASVDPDTTTNLLTYQFNVSTSTSLDDSKWQPMGNSLATSIILVFGNSYVVGVRAIDDFGNISAPIVETWNFPPGFVPYILGNSVSSASQDFVLPASTTPAGGVVLHSIGVFTTDLSSGSRYPEYNWCTLDLYDLESTSTDGSPLYLASNDGLIQGYTGCQGNPVFTFDSSAVQLLPSHHYRWVFNMNTGNVSTQAAVRFWGTAADTAHGAFSDPTLANAKFTVNTAAGALFGN